MFFYSYIVEWFVVDFTSNINCIFGGKITLILLETDMKHIKKEKWNMLNKEILLD